MLNNLYKQNSANYPRLETDTFFADYNNLCKFGEITDVVLY